MRGDPPRLGARLLHVVQGGQRRLQSVDVAGGLGLLEAAVLRRTAGDAVGTQLRPQATRGRHDVRLEIRMRCGVAFELRGDAHLQVPMERSPLADQLAQRIALLPALQAMLCDLLGLVLPGVRSGSSGQARMVWARESRTAGM